MNWGPMLATAGGLVFTGGTNDRYFHAFDAKTGKLLWQIPDQLRHHQPAHFILPSTASSTSPCSPVGAWIPSECKGC